MIIARPEDQILRWVARRTNDPANTDELRQLLQLRPDWEYLKSAADRHSIIPLLLTALVAANSSDVPAAALADLQTANHQNTNSNFVLTGELFKLLDLLRANNIQAIPFKGPTLAVRAYGDVGLRQFGDLDILVRPSDVARTKALLIEQGFRPHQLLTVAQEAALLRFDCACNFLSQHGVAVDIHWELIDRHQGLAIDTHAFWKRLEPVTVNGRELLTLSSEDLLLFLCLHGFTHYWERLSWICDIAALLQSEAAIDWNQLWQTAETNGALRILVLGLWLAHDVLQAPLPQHILKAAQEDEVVQQVAEEVEQHLFATTRQAKGLFSEAALLMRLRERKRDKLKSFLSLMGTPRSYDWLWVSFPDSFSFLYYLIRPVRLAAKYGSQLFQSTKQEKTFSDQTVK